MPSACCHHSDRASCACRSLPVDGRCAEGSLTSSRAEQPVRAPLKHAAAISAVAAAAAAVRRVARIAGVATICHRPNDEGSYLTTLDMAPRRFGRAAPNGTLPSGRVLAVTSCQVLRPPQPSNNGRNHFLRPCFSSAGLATLVQKARCASLRGDARKTACLRVG